MDEKLKQMKRRILEISYKNKLSHLGSCLTALPIIQEIYDIKKRGEKFILSEGHAAIALYCILEKHEGRNPEYLLKKHGIHAGRDEKNGIWCTTGSLGQGLPIAVGMSLANRKKNVYCIISDGEAAEGSIWEALRIKTDNNLDNLKVYVNLNEYGAYGKINSVILIKRLKAFCPDVIIKRTNVQQLPFLKGQNAHYYIMTSQDYKKALDLLK